MAYVSLYRKYRPQTFAEVVGQDHVTRTVMNAIESDKLHHAYLFTGPRGTGKTSTARILAKSINCENGPTATPCNTCRHCTEITAGSSMDVIELDMASHGGVDDARELRDRALFAPASARKKVYILDEVHMASTAAFNALLKLIEEPPGHVVFTMATTDPQKVLPTIMSRVQRLDLRRVSAPDVAAHLRDLCGREGRTIDDRALDAVVRAGDGSVRDSLSVLEQVLSYVTDVNVSGDEVDAVLGTTDVNDTAGLVDAISVGDLAAALGIVQSLLGAGRDLRRFAFDLLQHLRDLLVLQVAPTRPDLVDATEERRAVLQRQAQTVEAALLVQAVDFLATAVTEMRLGPPRLPLELVLAKLTVGRGINMAAVAGVQAVMPATEPANLARAAAATAAAATQTPTTPAEPQPSPAEEPTLPPEAEPEPTPEPAPEPTPEPTPEPEPAPEPTLPPVADPTASVQPSHATPERDEASVQPSHATPERDEAKVQPSHATPERGNASAEAGDVEALTPQPSLAARARALAEEPGEKGPGPDRPAGPEAVVEPPPPAPSDEDLARIQQRWDAVLEALKDHGMRVKAIFEPAHPIKLRNNVLTLRYSVRYGSFHAENAGRGEFADALTAAIEKTCGIRVKVDTLVEGNDAPPGSSPVSAAPTAPEEARKAQVREAEADDVELDPAADQRRAVALLVNELGATPIDD